MVYYSLNSFAPSKWTFVATPLRFFTVKDIIQYNSILPRQMLLPLGWNLQTSGQFFLAEHQAGLKLSCRHEKSSVVYEMPATECHNYSLSLPHIPILIVSGGRNESVKSLWETSSILKPWLSQVIAYQYKPLRYAYCSSSWSSSFW